MSYYISDTMSIGSDPCAPFDSNRRPKLVVRTLTDWFTNKKPANLGK